MLTRLRRLTLLSIAGVALHPACAASTEIRASDFDQSCVHDGDCVGVFDGEVCDCGPLHGAAIAASAADAFNERRNAMGANCPGSGCNRTICSFSSGWGPGAYCASGKCAVCVDCPDAGDEPDTGFVLRDAKTCPTQASVVPGAPCTADTPSCAGEIATCDGGVQATMCLCQSDAAQWAWTCTSAAPSCNDAGADDAAIDAGD